ncbi:DUF1120 domain-containing protein [Ewingella americana]|uniref:DUF1120 domain-containing protein n=1 Tax=Ewingella americana TaxID=41202 RepID=UPI0012AD44A4|nr:DUF1120 domain-containing protein [Ewingella americana]MRT03214.1 DUF1120 domain-containing protein [Ewingella americana]
MENKAMNNIFKVTAMACLMSAAANAFAGPSTNLQVTGSVKMGACTVTLDNNIVDYGNFNVLQLPDQANQLPHKYLSMQINCSTPTLLNWGTIDNRIGTSNRQAVLDAGINGVSIMTANTNMFGMGKTKEGSNIGAYTFAFDYNNMTSDIGDAQLINLQTNLDGTGGEWLAAQSALAVSGVNAQTKYFALSNQADLIPIAFKNLTIPIKIAASLGSINNTRISEVTAIDGSATILINYL